MKLRVAYQALSIMCLTATMALFQNCSSPEASGPSSKSDDGGKVLMSVEWTDPDAGIGDGTTDDTDSTDGRTDDTDSTDGRTDDGDNTANDGTGDGSTDDGSTDDGSTDDGSTDDGSTDDGSTDDGSSDDGSTDDGSSDDGSSDDGSSDDGSSDDGSSDDGSTDDGSTDDGSTDDGSTDDGSSDGSDSGEGTAEEPSDGRTDDDDNTAGDGSGDDSGDDTADNGDGRDPDGEGPSLGLMCGEHLVHDIIFNFSEMSCSKGQGKKSGSLEYLSGPQSLSNLLNTGLLVTAHKDTMVTTLFAKLSHNGNVIVMSDFSHLPLKVPSGQASGLKIKFQPKAFLQKGKTYLIRMQLKESFKLHYQRDRCMMTPPILEVAEILPQ